jgi:hypothetical protein
MAAPLLARLALEAQDAFVAASKAVPSPFHERTPAGLSPAAWTITHVAEAHHASMYRLQ